MADLTLAQEPREDDVEGVWDRRQAAREAASIPALPGLLGRASRAVTSVIDDGLSVSGLTATQFEVLASSLAVGYAAVSELADGLGMAPATVSSVVQRLESKGLV